MSSAIHTYEAGQLGSVTFGINGLVEKGYAATLALRFRTSANICGLDAGFHATTVEIRAFAAELIRHADITDAKQAELDAGAAA